MKSNRIISYRQIIAPLIFMFFCATLAGCRYETDSIAPEKTSYAASQEDSETSDSLESLKIPPEFENYAENQSPVWMAGMWVEHLNCSEMKEADLQVFEMKDSVVRIRVLLQNGLEKKQPYYFMILADGLPVQFTVEEEKRNYYPVELDRTVAFEAEYEAVFEMDSGRVDYLFFYDGDPVSEFHSLCQTAVFKNHTAKAAADKNNIETVPLRSGLRSLFGEGSVRSWLSPKEVLGNPDYMETHQRYQLGEDDELVLEAVMAKEGRYRTVMICGHEWHEIKSESSSYDYIDWEASSGRMLQLPVCIPEGRGKPYSCFTIHTPIEPARLNEAPYISGKTEIFETGESNE